MKKIICLLLILITCLSLCACGSMKLTEAVLHDTLSGCDGALHVETSGNSINGFTFVVDVYDAEVFRDKERCRQAIYAAASGDEAMSTGKQAQVARAFAAPLCIVNLFEHKKSKFDAVAFLEKTLGLVCDGTVLKYDGYSVSAEVDLEHDTLTIRAIPNWAGELEALKKLLPWNRRDVLTKISQKNNWAGLPLFG